MKNDFFLISCEHGGNRIPIRYRPLFDGYEDLLSTHRGYDAGALRMARELADALGAPLHASTVSRLLVDLNRSTDHPRRFSEATRAAPEAIQREIHEHYYLAYRNKIEMQIAQAIAGGDRVIHISAHSFTPELNGKTRDADIGLLYDPARAGELELCRRWRNELKMQAPGLRTRMNYPYTGKSDGFTSALRRCFSADQYVGIEVEINQKHVFDGQHWHDVRQAVIDTLCRTFQNNASGLQRVAHDMKRANATTEPHMHTHRRANRIRGSSGG